MNPFRQRPLRIQPYFGYRSRTRLILRARALRSAKPGFDKGGRWQAMRTMLAQFASHEVEGVAVSLRLENGDDTLLECMRHSDAEGFVLFDVALDPALDLPPQPVWETASLHWLADDGPACIAAHVFVPGRDSELGVISDIDDTIIETGITGGIRAIARNWRRVLAQLPDERIAVPGADVFYGALGGGQVLPPGEKPASARVPATRRPFFYVSSSPWNLFSYLVAFQRANRLPLGPLMLRDWGLNLSTLGSSSHGEHKRAAIDALMAMYPHLRFALIGDDTQGDLPAYAGVVEDNRAAVAAIFIRTTAAHDFSPEERAAKAAIEAAGVPLWLGDSYAVERQFLHAAGFAGDDEAAQIVEVVDKHAQPGPAGL